MSLLIFSPKSLILFNGLVWSRTEQLSRTRGIDMLYVESSKKELISQAINETFKLKHDKVLIVLHHYLWSNCLIRHVPNKFIDILRVLSKPITRLVSYKDYSVFFTCQHWYIFHKVSGNTTQLPDELDSRISLVFEHMLGYKPAEAEDLKYSDDSRFSRQLRLLDMKYKCLREEGWTFDNNSNYVDWDILQKVKELPLDKELVTNIVKLVEEDL